MKPSLFLAAVVVIAGCGDDDPVAPDARPRVDAGLEPPPDAPPPDAAAGPDAAPELGPWWQVSFGGPGDESATAVDVSASDMIAIGGSFTASFDPGTGMLEAGGGDYNVFVAMMTPSGALRWATALSADAFASVDDVAFEEESGDVFVGGTFQGRLIVDGVEHAGEGGFDGYVARLSGDDGTVRWLRTCSNPDDGTITAIDVVDGDVLVGGVFESSIELGGELLTGTSQLEAYIARLAGDDGAHVWSAALGDTDFGGRGMNILVHAGRAYIGADFYDTTAFGEDFKSFGLTDVVLAELDPGDGGVVWSHHYGSTDYDGIDDLAADAGGNLYVLGRYRGPASFGGEELPRSGLVEDNFVARYDADGNHTWSRRNELDGMPEADSVGIGANDREVLIAQNSFVSQYHPADGAVLDELRWFGSGFGANPGTSWSQRAVAAGPTGTLVLVGGMTGTLEFTGPHFEGQPPLDAIAGSDVIIVTRPAGDVE